MLRKVFLSAWQVLGTAEKGLYILGEWSSSAYVFPYSETVVAPIAWRCRFRAAVQVIIIWGPSHAVQVMAEASVSRQDLSKPVNQSKLRSLQPPLDDLFFAVRVASSAHNSEAYNSLLLTTVSSSFLFEAKGPPWFGIRRPMVTADRVAFADAPATCVVNDPKVFD